VHEFPEDTLQLVGVYLFATHSKEDHQCLYMKRTPST
jgi:hypothetical protein